MNYRGMKHPEISATMQAREHLGDDYDRLIAHYMFHGYIYFGNDAVIMAAPMNKLQLLEGFDESDDNLLKKELDKHDCWYVQYAAGKINRFFEVCPFPLEWVVFERWGDKRRRAYKFNRLERYSHGRT